MTGQMKGIAQRLREEIARLPHGVWVEWHPIMIEAADEIDRLNKWADGFSDAQLKERRLCEERIKEMQREITALRSLARKDGDKRDYAGSLSKQLIDAAARPGVDAYTQTVLWHASQFIDSKDVDNDRPAVSDASQVNHHGG